MDSELALIRHQLDAHSRHIADLTKLIDRIVDRMIMNDGCTTPPPHPKSETGETISGVWLVQGRKKKTWTFYPFALPTPPQDDSSKDPQHFFHEEGGHSDAIGHR